MNPWADTLREHARAGLAPIEGEIRVPGLREPVEVIRDRWGVPHIYANSVRDVFFAANYVSCSERLFQLDFMLRLANGRLAELLADLALPLDRFFRTVGLHRAGRTIAEGMDDFSLEVFDAALAGANAWIETMPARPVEYEILDLDPEPFPTGEEGAAYGNALSAFMSWMLSGNWDNELLRMEIAETLGFEAMLALFPDIPSDPSVVMAGKDAASAEAGGRHGILDLLRTAALPPSMQGSNNWVVAGSRSVTGKPLLANDPHILAQTPSIWFEVHLVAPGLDVAGVSLPTVVGIQIGHGPHVGWGFTNVGGDTQDVYVERMNEDRTAAMYEGAWEPATVHREEIHVRGHDEPVVLEVPETRHGPIVDSYMVGVSQPEVVERKGPEAFALRWTGHRFAVSPTTMFRMATAGGVHAFRESLRGWHCPGQNVVFASVDGDIGYQCTGVYPIRRRGDGTVPVPGWTDQFEWDGFVPFDDLPWSLNPDDGFLATANQKIHDDAYPHLIGHDFLPPHRARRIVELLTAEPVHSKETFARMHSDTVSNVARAIVPHLMEIEPGDDRQKQALAHLDGWDCSLAADSVAACIYQVWCRHLAEVILLPKMGQRLFDHYYARRQWTVAFQYQVLPDILAFPTAMWFGADGRAGRDERLREALNAALDELETRLGDDMTAWTWGTLHQIRFRGQLAIIPDLTELFTAGEAPWGGDEMTICQGLFEPGGGTYDVAVVPSWRQILDLSDWDASVGTHTVGQSGNPASPHWNDLFALWSKGEYHPLLYSRPAVEAAAEGTLRILPAS